MQVKNVLYALDSNVAQIEKAIRSKKSLDTVWTAYTNLMRDEEPVRRESLNPPENSLRFAPALSVFRRRYVFLVGGARLRNPDKMFNTVEMFDTKQNSWQNLPALLLPVR